MYVSATYNMSDQNLKTDITTLTNALSELQNIRGCRFRWNNNEQNQVANRVDQETLGVIAQEVRAAGINAKLCVSEASTFLAVGRGAGPFPPGPGADYTKMVPLLIEACKELGRAAAVWRPGPNGEVQTLKRRCVFLENGQFMSQT